MVVLLVAAYGITASFEIRSLVKKKYWRDLVVFCLFMALSFTASVLYASGVQLPNPIVAIHNFLDWVGLHY